MVATMSVYFDFGGGDGASGTQQDIDALGPPTLRFKLADDANIDTNAKLVIPGGGLGPYYSWWKQIYLYCDNPDGNTISAVKFYADGANGFGVGCDVDVGSQFPTHNSGSEAGYEVATGAGDEGDEMVANHGGIAAKASIFSYTVGAPLSVSISEAGSVINAATETTNYVVLQWETANTAGAGATSSETFTFSYTEA